MALASFVPLATTVPTKVVQRHARAISHSNCRNLSSNSSVPIKPLTDLNYAYITLTGLYFFFSSETQHSSMSPQIDLNMAPLFFAPLHVGYSRGTKVLLYSSMLPRCNRLN